MGSNPRWRCPKYYYGDYINEDEMGKTYTAHGRDEKRRQK